MTTKDNSVATPNTQTSRKRRNSEPLQAPTSIPQSIIDFLSNHRFFSSWSSKQLRKLCLEELSIQRYHSGDTVIEEGTYGKSLYLVISGTIECRSIKSDCIFTLLGEGSFFGEVGAIYYTKRMATCQVRSATATLARIEGSSMIRHFSKTPQDRQVILEMANLAQQRYLKQHHHNNSNNNNVKSVNNSNLTTALQKHFPLLLQRLANNPSPSALKAFLSHCSIETKTKDTIISFKNDTFSTSILLLDGYLTRRDCSRGSGSQGAAVKTFTPGTMIVNPYGDGILEYIMVDGGSSSSSNSGNGNEEIMMDESTNGSTTATFIKLPLKTLKKCLDGCLIEEEEENEEEAEAEAENVSKNHQQQQQTPPPSPPLQTKQRRNSQTTEQRVFQTLPFTMPITTTTTTTTAETNKSLKRFSLRGSQSITEHLEAWSLSPLIKAKGPYLEELVLANSSITGAELLQSLDPCSKLKVLELSGCFSVGGDDFLAFIKEPSCASLERLNISNNHFLKDSILKEIAKTLPALKELDIGYSRNLSNRCWEVMPHGIERLSMHRMIDSFATAKPPTLPNLKFVDLSDCAFLEVDALKALLDRMPSLEELVLRHCTSLNDSILKNSSSPFIFSNLKVLDLSFCPRLLGHESLKGIFKRAPNLRRLNLRGGRFQNYRKIITTATDVLPFVQEITLSSKEFSPVPMVEGEKEVDGDGDGSGEEGISSSSSGCYSSILNTKGEKVKIIFI